MVKKKTFDSVGMVRQLREAHFDQTKDLTKAERLTYYQEKSQQAQAKLEQLAKEQNNKTA